MRKIILALSIITTLFIMDISVAFACSCVEPFPPKESLEKASESEKDDTDVSSQYSQYSKGVSYKNLNDKKFYFADGTLTTRSNGNIFMEVDGNGNINFYAEKASSNHSKL